MTQEIPNTSSIKKRISKIGVICAGFFLSLFVGLFSFLRYSASRNPADSGEGGVLLLPFVAPWLFMVPDSIVGSTTWDSISTLMMWLFAILNSLIIYFICVGMTALFQRKSS